MSGTSKKKLFLNSIIYSFSGILIKCFSLFLLPLYTIYLTPTDYGITSLVSSFVVTMGFIVSCSLCSAIMRFYVDLKNDSEKLKRFYGTITLFVFLSNFFFFILATLFRGVLSKYIFKGIDYYPVILLALLSLMFNCQQNIYINILQSQQKATKLGALSIIFFFITLGLNIIFIVVLKMGAVGSLLAYLISYILYTVIFLIDLIHSRSIKFCLDFKLLKSSLKFSLPLVPHNISTQIAVFVSKILINGNSSAAGLGLYALASQFGDMADTFQVYSDQAYGPWLYEKLNAKEENYKNDVRKISKSIIYILGLLLIGIALFSQDFILLFLDDNYVQAWKYIPLIVGVFAIKISYYFYVEVLFYDKKASRKLFIATLSSSVINIVLTYFLVPHLDVYGSILADAIAMFIRVAIIVIISKKYEDVGLRLRDFIFNFIIIVSIIATGLIFSYIKYYDVFNWMNFLYKCLILLIYIGLVFLINKKDLIKVLHEFKKRKGI